MKVKVMPDSDSAVPFPQSNSGSSVRSEVPGGDSDYLGYISFQINATEKSPFFVKLTFKLT